MSSLISSQIEDVLQTTIFPELEKGRKNFDLPHTQAVVYWMKELLTLLENPDLDPQVLITAAYAHDWGYIGLFDGINSDDPQEIAKRKPLHMERSSQLIGELIDSQLSEFFTPAQKDHVQHLVSIHDKVENLETEAELLLMEADTMGMLDADRVTPTFTKENNQKLIGFEIRQRRLPRFIHPQAKTIAEELVKKRLAFYEQ